MKYKDFITSFVRQWNFTRGESVEILEFWMISNYYLSQRVVSGRIWLSNLDVWLKPRWFMQKL
ncbi:hypothetical protein HYW42_01240 [Candidatus Daviesbacteria bacterium]|nr:hypothetical protein [Candidatus Daviesbacteria bacterium]